MSDIVEMLRATASHPHNQHGPQEWLSEAAAEITRLRAENELLRRRVERYRKAWENEKRRFTETMAATGGDNK